MYSLQFNEFPIFTYVHFIYYVLDGKYKIPNCSIFRGTIDEKLALPNNN